MKSTAWITSALVIALALSTPFVAAWTQEGCTGAIKRHQTSKRLTQCWATCRQYASGTDDYLPTAAFVIDECIRDSGATAQDVVERLRNQEAEEREKEATKAEERRNRDSFGKKTKHWLKQKLGRSN